MGARCSWTGGRGNLARSCANRSCVFSRNVFVDSINGEWVPNRANLPIKSSHSRIDLLKSSSMATTSRRWRVGTAALVSSSAPGSLSWAAYVPSGRSVCNENAGGSNNQVRAAAARDNANRQPVFVLGRGGDFSCRFRARGLFSSTGDGSKGEICRESLASVLHAASLSSSASKKRAQYTANTQQLRLREAPLPCASLRGRNAVAAERAKALNHHRSSLQPRAHKPRWTPSAAASHRP